MEKRNKPVELHGWDDERVYSGMKRVEKNGAYLMRKNYTTSLLRYAGDTLRGR